MNGATEATLAELLRVAEQQNKNLSELVKAFKATGGKTTGAGSSDANKRSEESSSKASASMGVLGAAVNAVTGIFNTLFEIVGKVVGGLAKTVVNLAQLGAQAATTGARLSDLYNAFKDLPFFIGDLMGVFAQIVKFSETLLDTYRDLTKSGASFSGNLFEMLQAATNGYLTLNEFANVIRNNSDIFATMGGNVQNGINKFSEYSRNLLGPESKFGKQMLGLGYTIEESANAIADYLRGQGTINKRGLDNAETVSAGVMAYAEELDNLTKMTGMQREQIEKGIKEQEMEATWNEFVAGLTKEQSEFVRAASAQAMATGGPEYMKQIRLGFQGVFAPVTKDMQYLAAATGGKTVQAAEAARRIMLSNMSEAEKLRAMREIDLGIAQDASARARSMGKETMAVLTAMGDPMGKAANQFRLTAIKVQDGTAAVAEAEAQRKKQYEGNAASLAKAEQGMRQFGTTIMSLVARVLEPITNRLLAWGGTLIDSMGTIVKELQGPMTKIADFLEKYFFPQLEKIGRWFADTFIQLSSVQNVKDFWKIAGERLKDAWSNMKEVLGPPMKAMWEAVKPDIIAGFKAVFELMTDVIGDWVHEKTGLGESSKDRHDREAAMQTQHFKRWEEFMKTQGNYFQRQRMATGSQEEIYEMYKAQIETGKYKSATATETDGRTARTQAAQMDPRRVDQSRDFGTSGILGLNAEPKDTTVNIEKGERVLNPKETQSYNNLDQAMNQLNNLTAQILQAMRENNDLTRKNVDATKGLSGNLFA